MRNSGGAPPVPFQVKAGENKILIEQPYTGEYQSWGISFIPVKKSGDRWIADPSYSVKPGGENKIPSFAPMRGKNYFPFWPSFWLFPLPLPPSGPTSS